MPKAKLDGEIRVHQFLSGLGLRPERFGALEMANEKTPDFRIFAANEFAFYCEVKTAQVDECAWAGLTPDPTYNRIGNQIHEAVKQFDAVNPLSVHPNVLALVNGDDQAEFADLVQVLTGNAYCEGGDVIPMFRHISEGRIREEKLRIGLYLWFDAWKHGEPARIFTAADSLHGTALRRYFRL